MTPASSATTTPPPRDHPAVNLLPALGLFTTVMMVVGVFWLKKMVKVEV